MLKSMKYLIISLIIFTFQTIVYANENNSTLNQLLKNISSMQADFNQKLVDNKGKEIQNSLGKMALKRPGKFRWETISPNKQLVIANGKHLWIYDADLEQVIIRGLASQAGQTPALLLSDANPALETDFKITVQKQVNSDLIWYVLLPKDPESMFENIRMGFKNNNLQQMQLHDHLGHTTIIQFKNIKMNMTLADAYFYFVPPKNVDIIDETKPRK